MAVNAKLGVVRKVGAELQKERPEVLVDAIKIVVVDHGRRLHDPRIGRAGTRAAPTLRAHDPRLLLCLADVQHTFGLLELAQIPLGNVVLALPLLESNEIDAFGSDELLDIANKGPGHRRHRRRRCKPLAMVNPQIPHRGSHRLQVGHINVEIHAVDRLVLKNHMITQHIRHGSCYPHRGLRSSTGPRTHRALSSHTQGMSLQARPGSTQINPESPLSSAQAVPIYLVGLRRSLVSFTRPDRNVASVANMVVEIQAKRLELLLEVVLQARRVAALLRRMSAAREQSERALRTADGPRDNRID